jgi:hypothetical protein
MPISTNGAIVFESPNVSITPRTTRQDFISSTLYSISEPLNQNVPWSRYGFRPAVASGEQYAGDICFRSGAIYSVALSSLRPEFGTSWNDMSAEKERARHEFHKRLLQDIIKRPPDEVIARGQDQRDADIQFRFSWGTVSACTDFKSGGCDIFIKYEAGR